MTNGPVLTENAPMPIGPYSQAMRSGNMLFISGQLGIDPTTNEMGNDLTRQTELSLSNLLSIVEAAGGRKGSIVKTTIFLHDMDTFTDLNKVYSSFFEDHRPARSTVQARLPKDALVEIEAVAVLRP